MLEEQQTGSKRRRERRCFASGILNQLQQIAAHQELMDTAAADESVVAEETVTAMSVDQPECTLLIQPSKRLGKPPFTMIVPCSYTWADCKRDEQFRSQVDVKTFARSHGIPNVPGYFVVSSLDAPAVIAIRARNTLSAAQKAVSDIKCGKRTRSRWLDENGEIVQSKDGALKQRSKGAKKQRSKGKYIHKA